MKRIILASRSPARKKILEDAELINGIAYADIDESRLPHESVKQYAVRVAEAKAREVAKHIKNAIVIGVDTVISLHDHILGKPKDKKAARAYLNKLSGRWHEVYSGTVVINSATGKTIKKLVVSRVKFARLSNEQIDWYVNTGEPMHVAGAYSIQGKGRALIESVDGCLTNVIGISIPVLHKMLKSLKAI